MCARGIDSRRVKEKTENKMIVTVRANLQLGNSGLSYFVKSPTYFTPQVPRDRTRSQRGRAKRRQTHSKHKHWINFE